MPSLLRTKPAARSSTRYQREKVPCFCPDCKGFKIPKHAARRHAQLHPTETLPPPIDHRYRTQPFDPPRPTLQVTTTAGTSTPAPAPAPATAPATAAITTAAFSSVAADSTAIGDAGPVAADELEVLETDGLGFDDLYWDGDTSNFVEGTQIFLLHLAT